MGISIAISEFDMKIDDFIQMALKYKCIINNCVIYDEKFTHRSKEIYWALENLKKQINRLEECVEQEDFSYNLEEKEFYSARMRFLLSLI